MRTCLLGLLSLILGNTLGSAPGLAQTLPQSRGAESFASENAILDTSVLFAIGAQEARQALRGSFGWPTFQEGLVQGVYYRFDPDGYARFSPSPRLDSDVFEVICRPRTYSCMGRKDGLSMMLTNRGQLQLKFEDVMPADRFFVASGVSEIQVPERILQPLDHQFEALLATGGELIIRRGDDEIGKISLEGFHPVVTYLRWVLSRQDYTVLPRGWPVPNSREDTGQSDVTNVVSWESPMPQPQVLAPDTFASSENAANTFDGSENVDAVREELKFLRELLLERSAQQGVTVPAGNLVLDTPIFGANVVENAMPQSSAIELQTALLELQAEIKRLQSGVPPAGGAQYIQTPDVKMLTGEPVSVNSGVTDTSPATVIHDDGLAELDLPRKLRYLIEEVGLAPDTALTVLQAGSSSLKQNQDGQTAPTNVHLSTLSPGDVVSEILKELEGDLSVENHSNSEIVEQTHETVVTRQEYQLLSSYFRSVVFPDLAP